ncbi:hypothetical protein AALI21_02840 [Corynebacteriaceae bacterium 6-324]
MPCSKSVLHEQYLEEARYTRDEFEFFRSFGCSKSEAIRRLEKSLRRSSREIARHLAITAQTEELAA